MKTKTKFQKGLTLVELMTAVVTGTIVVLAIGMVVFLGQTSWNDAWKKANLQRDASYAMLRMSQSVKAATSASVSEDDDGITLNLTIDGNSVTFSYAADTHDLQYQFGALSPQTVIDGKVEDLQFNVQGNKVTIDLNLEEDNAETHFVSTIVMRNTGG